ncbi:MAG: hypothetical protein ACR2KE_04520 [Candidatus Nanopelagicales bacterium]
MRKAIAICAAGLALALPALPAVADEGGSLAIIPASGTLDTPMDVVTSGLCQRGVTFVVAVRGTGIDPVLSGNAVGNTDLAILEPAAYPGHHSVPLSRTLREYFVSNGVVDPRGDYDLVFACRNRLDMADLQTFAGTIRIGKAGYQALGVAATPLEKFLANSSAGEASSAASSGQESGAAASEAPSPVASSSGPAASGETAVGDQAEGSVTSAESAASENPAQASAGSVGDVAALPASSTSTTPQEDNTWRWALITMGAVLLAGAAYMGWKARAR